MNKEWQTKTLAEVCEIKPPKREARERLSAGGLVSFLPMEDLGIDEKFLRATQTKPLSAVAGSYTYFAEGDVLLAKITPCFENGKLGIAERLTNGIGFGSSEYIVFRPDKTVSKEWLYYYLSRETFRNEGAARMSGAVGHKRVSKEFIESYPIPIPPLLEQQRIVGVLDEAFEGIATAKANAEKNIRNARALFESHLQTVCTQRGEGWVEKTLGDVCDLFQGLAINSKSKHLLVAHSSLPLLRIKDLRNNSEEQFVAESGFPPNARVNASEIIYTRTGQIGLVFRGRSGVLHNNCFKIRPKHGLDNDYLFWWLQSPDFRTRITTLASRAAQPDITHTIFKVQPIMVPPLSAQKIVAETVTELAAETQRLKSIYQQKVAAIDTLKKSLMHEAFSGKL
jgi:type I restriction enzyme, S subunit